MDVAELIVLRMCFLLLQFFFGSHIRTQVKQKALKFRSYNRVCLALCLCPCQAYDGLRPPPGTTCRRAGALRGGLRDTWRAPHPANTLAHGGAAGPQPTPQCHLLHHQADPASTGPHIPADRGGCVQLVPGAPNGEAEKSFFFISASRILRVQISTMSMIHFQ